MIYINEVLKNEVTNISRWQFQAQPEHLDTNTQIHTHTWETEMQEPRNLLMKTKFKNSEFPSEIGQSTTSNADHGYFVTARWLVGMRGSKLKLEKKYRVVGTKPAEASTLELSGGILSRGTLVQYSLSPPKKFQVKHVVNPRNLTLNPSRGRIWCPSLWPRNASSKIVVRSTMKALPRASRNYTL